MSRLKPSTPGLFSEWWERSPSPGTTSSQIRMYSYPVINTCSHTLRHTHRLCSRSCNREKSPSYGLEKSDQSGLSISPWFPGNTRNFKR